MRRRMRNKGIEFKENKNNESEYRVVVELSNGKKFGELAFQNNTRRTAGIFTKTDCYFLILNRYNYSKILLKVWKAK